MLNEQQKRAVEHGDGPMMVVAGPGSGKTRVLTERVRALLKRTTPERICVITFARKAAEEMRSRFASMTDEETASLVTFGTFHSVFFRMLRGWGLLAKNTRIMEEEEQLSWLKDQGRDGDIPVSFLLQGDGADRPDADRIRRAYFAYKRENSRIDFDDILRMMDAAIEYYAAFRDFDYFLVDEFQDIDEQQYSILKRMVCAPGEEAHANLFVVGDEDQAIYAFRGSRPEIFLNFQKDFPGCKRVDLSVNYRSDPEIVDTSLRLISHNKMRFQKKIRAGKVKRGIPGIQLYRPVRVTTYFDEQEEARHISERIRWSLLWQFLSGERETMAVLCRSSEEAGRIMIYLKEAGVPCMGREEWSHRQERHVVILRRDFEVLKRLSVHPEDQNALQSLSEAFPEVWQAGYSKRLQPNTELLQGLLVQNRMSASLRAEIRALYKVTEWIRNHPDKEKIGMAKMMLETGYFFRALKRMRKRQGGMVDLLLQIREIYFPSRHPVSVMTMHGSKGLEFDKVYILSLVQGKMPRKEALREDKEKERRMEEERRLLYVAVTRAKKKLRLSSYNGLGTESSQFLHEMVTEASQSPSKTSCNP